MPAPIEVHAKQGKRLRAEPIAQLYAQGLVHHVGEHPRLEGRLVTWIPGMGSPDRMDAVNRPPAQSRPRARRDHGRQPRRNRYRGRRPTHYRPRRHESRARQAGGPGLVGGLSDTQVDDVIAIPFTLADELLGSSQPQRPVRRWLSDRTAPAGRTSSTRAPAGTVPGAVQMSASRIAACSGGQVPSNSSTRRAGTGAYHRPTRPAGQVVQHGVAVEGLRGEPSHQCRVRSGAVWPGHFSERGGRGCR